MATRPGRPTAEIVLREDERETLERWAAATEEFAASTGPLLAPVLWWARIAACHRCSMLRSRRSSGPESAAAHQMASSSRSAARSGPSVR